MKIHQKYHNNQYLCDFLFMKIKSMHIYIKYRIRQKITSNVHVTSDTKGKRKFRMNLIDVRIFCNSKKNSPIFL